MVEIVPYQAYWPAEFQQLASQFRQTLGATALRIDHIGSTAVPGLAAVDVIDIQLTVPTLAEADGVLARRLADAGFPRVPGERWDHPCPPPGGDRWEKRLHGAADPARPVNLHVRAVDSPGWRQALLTRDHLRADPDRRAAYLLLERELAASAPDGVAYTTARDPWFDEGHLRAEEWAAQTGWRP